MSNNCKMQETKRVLINRNLLLMWHVQARRIKLFHTKKHDFDLTVFPSILSECQDRKHWISSNLSSLNPRTCHRKISRSILVRSTRIISSSIREGINTFFRPTTFTYDILLRMNNALKCHQSGCVSLNLSPLLSREYSS